jgi:hypothetical protein
MLICPDITRQDIANLLNGIDACLAELAGNA